MRSHTSCADWGYDHHPDRPKVADRCGRLCRIASRRPAFFDRLGFDTRSGHAFVFGGMTPASCTCILGNYRGTASCLSLLNCTVSTPHDPRVGVPPLLVDFTMGQLFARCSALVVEHKKWVSECGYRQPPQIGLTKFVGLLAFVLQQFLTIHPYMDGNGHMGRLLIYVMMCRAGYVPANWNIDAKQPYADALSAHRSGQPGALEKFLLGVIGPSQPAQSTAP